MARIAGVNIPTNKRVHIALTYVFGIGRTSARKICAELSIGDGTAYPRVNELSEDELNAIRGKIDEQYQVKVTYVVKYP